MGHEPPTCGGISLIHNSSPSSLRATSAYRRAPRKASAHAASRASARAAACSLTRKSRSWTRLAFPPASTAAAKISPVLATSRTVALTPIETRNMPGSPPRLGSRDTFMSLVAKSRSATPCSRQAKRIAVRLLVADSNAPGSWAALPTAAKLILAWSGGAAADPWPVTSTKASSLMTPSSPSMGTPVHRDRSTFPTARYRCHAKNAGTGRLVLLALIYDVERPREDRGPTVEDVCPGAGLGLRQGEIFALSPTDIGAGTRRDSCTPSGGAVRRQRAGVRAAEGKEDTQGAVARRGADGATLIALAKASHWCARPRGSQSRRGNARRHRSWRGMVSTGMTARSEPPQR